MMKKHLPLMVALVLVCGHISAWAGINEDLLSAAEKGNTEEVRRLLKAHADVSARDNVSRTPLHFAAAGGHLEAATLLLEHRADVNAVDVIENTPLHGAATSGQNRMAELLLAHQANINARDLFGVMPIHLAASSGNRKTVELLLAHQAKVNAADKSGNTPLHAASRWKRPEIVQLLLEHGADANAENHKGVTPLQMAVEFPKHASRQDPEGEVLPMLTPAEADVNRELVTLLLAKGAKIDASDMEGATALHSAARVGATNVVELLLSSGADVNVSSKVGVTPLYLAARYDRKEVAEILLAHGAHAEPAAGEVPPLMIAASNGNSAVADVLLQHGANANLKDNEGRPILLDTLSTASLIYALSSPILGDALTPDLRKQISQRRKIVKGEWIKVASLLVEHGADVNAEGGFGIMAKESPLYMAATMGERDLTELLLKKGAYVNGNKTGCSCETPLHSAIAENHPEVAKLLIEYGANVNALNRSRRTPLHFLAWYMKDKGLAQLMISKGADVNAREKGGETPYDAAMRAGNREVADVLKQYVPRGTGNTL